MLAVTVDTEKLDYDIHSLIKAFYPEETVKVISPSTDNEKAEDLKKHLFMDIVLKGSKQRIAFYVMDSEGKLRLDREVPFLIENMLEDNEHPK